MRAVAGLEPVYSDASQSAELTRLLEHPAIWRGTSVARTEALPTGFSALDERLPGKGWPRSGLIEILLPRLGIGELSLLLPAVAAATRHPTARWCVWVAPPLEPFAPALATHGVVLDRVLVVREPAARPKVNHALWAFEQALSSGACDIVMSWAACPQARAIRRLQLAAEQGRTLGVLFRSLQSVRESSHATLRMTLESTEAGMRATVLKSRGGVRGPVELALPEAGG